MKNYINGNYGRKLTLIPTDNEHITDDVFDRYFSYTANLNGNDRLGLQLVPGKDGISLFVVTDSKSALDYDDLSWILNGYASVRKGAPVRAFFTNSNRRVYVLAKGKNYSDDPFDCFSPEYLKDLFEEMRNTGTKMQLLTGTGACNKGCIFFSVPGAMSVKFKAILKMVFKDLEVRPFNEKCKAGHILLTKRTAMYTTSLLRRINEAKEDKPEGKLETVFTADEIEFDDDELPDFDDFPPETFDDNDFEPDTPKQPETKKEIPENLKLEELGFSVRTYSCLRRAGIKDLASLQNTSLIDLYSIRNLGAHGKEEVKAVLERFPSIEKAKAAEANPSGISYTQQLDDLIGLENVKEQVRKIAAYARMKKAMDETGSSKLSMALNTEFTGNPGTAKTTVARILAGIFHEIGLLKSNDIVEVGRSDLVAGYVGQTAPKVRDVFKKADGKLLFIDEAYSLVNTCGNDFGDEAIDAIVQEMENRRDKTIVIFAGYPDKMKAFFERNPGLRSRVPFSVNFSDYPVETLVRIAESEASKRGFKITADALGKVSTLCTEASSQTEFGNGRFCRNLVENAILNFASRNFGSDSKTAVPEAMDLIAEDFSMPTITKKTKPEKKFGFV